jgi:hypothetical protein
MTTISRRAAGAAGRGGRPGRGRLAVAIAAGALGVAGALLVAGGARAQIDADAEPIPPIEDGTPGVIDVAVPPPLTDDVGIDAAGPGIEVGTPGGLDATTQLPAPDAGAGCTCAVRAFGSLDALDALDVRRRSLSAPGVALASLCLALVRARGRRRSK